MHVDLSMSVAGLIIGVVVGLTGMGGGALMTPVLVLLFHTNPASAVSSDLVTSLFMKPVGGTIHWRRATVHRGIVLWLLVSAVPSAFCGVFLFNAIGAGAGVENGIKLALGAALALAFAGMVLRQFVGRTVQPADGDGLDAPVRILPTVLVGVLGGLVVGMTSVGSGSVMVVALMWLYPRLSNRALVGTDLVQAVPLVAAAALGHLLFGDVQFGITVSLLIGAIPGVIAGAQISSRTTAPWLRPVLAAVLLASALKLLDAPSVPTAVACVAVAVALLAVMRVRTRRHAAATRADGSAPAAVAAGAPRENGRRADLSKV